MVLPTSSLCQHHLGFGCYCERLHFRALIKYLSVQSTCTYFLSFPLHGCPKRGEIIAICSLEIGKLQLREAEELVSYLRQDLNPSVILDPPLVCLLLQLHSNQNTGIVCDRAPTEKLWTLQGNYVEGSRPLQAQASRRHTFPGTCGLVLCPGSYAEIPNSQSYGT
jgi:hypothetical protein